MTFQSGKHYTFGSYLDPTLVIELSTNDQKTSEPRSPFVVEPRLWLTFCLAVSVRRVDDSHSNQKWLAHKSLAGHWCFRSLWKPFYIGIKATASEGDPLSAVEVPFYFQCIDIPQGENNSESGLVTLVFTTVFHHGQRLPLVSQLGVCQQFKSSHPAFQRYAGGRNPACTRFYCR